MNKILLISSMMLFLFACGEKTASDNSGQDQSESSGGNSSSDLADDPNYVDESMLDQYDDPSDRRVYSGSIEYYNIVMVLEFEESTVTGQYYYLNKGKDIDLDGEYDSKSDKWKITETVKGKATGYFDLTFDDTGVSGGWSAKPDGDKLAVSLSPVKGEYERDCPNSSRYGGEYVNEHTIWVYNGQDDNGNDMEDENEVTDVMKINFINNDHFSFWYNVIGANAHIGEIAGVAEMVGADSAVFKIENCDLSFKFPSSGKIKVYENDCMDYHGARAWFGNGLERVK